MKDYISNLRNEVETTMLNDCMRTIFGDRVEAEVNAEDYEMQTISNELKKAFANLPISMSTLIGMAVQKHGGKIEFDPCYKFREGVLPFTSLKYDSTYGVYGCFGNRVDPTFGNEFIYIEREMTTDELDKLCIYLQGDDLKKAPYLNTIYELISSHEGHGVGYENAFNIYYNNVVELQRGDETLAHVVVDFYITDNGKVAVSTKCVYDDEYQHDLLRDFSLDEVKRLFDLFINLWYSTDENKQIRD